MTTTTAPSMDSPTDAPPSQASPPHSGSTDTTASAPRILVWDAPTRIFHWMLVAHFALAWLTAESEHWRAVHLIAGYTFFALIGFRLLWGLVGSRYARFSDFIRGPAAVFDYLRGFFSHSPPTWIGHNPAGALAIVMLLLVGIGTVASGWAMYNEVANGEWMEDVHEALASTLLAVAAVHVLGVAGSSWRHRENLVRAMIDGYKSGPASASIPHPHRVIGGGLILMVASLWWVGLVNSPAHLPGLDLTASVSPANESSGTAGHPPQQGSRLSRHKNKHEQDD